MIDAKQTSSSIHAKQSSSSVDTKQTSSSVDAKQKSSMIDAKHSSSSIVQLILQQDVGAQEASSIDDFQNLKVLELMLLKMSKNIKGTNFGQMVNFHCRNKSAKKTGFRFDPVPKRHLFSLFRAVFHRIVPKEMFENRKIEKLFLRNLSILLTSGKKSPVLLFHLIRDLDQAKILWIQRYLN
jgi:hypothetical protein